MIQIKRIIKKRNGNGTGNGAETKELQYLKHTISKDKEYMT